MILVTTPTGNTGQAVMAEVLRSGTPMRLFVRDRSKLVAVADSARTTILEGDLRDEAALRQAAQGMEAVFFCVPQSGDTDDVGAYYASFAQSAARAFLAAGVKRLVTISGGRGNPRDGGPSGPLAAMEKTFDATGIAARHVRCGYFMENFLYTLPQLAFRGSFSLPIAPDYPLALMAAQDIGTTAARWLLDSTWGGQEGVTVPLGESLSCQQIARVLSDTLETPITFDPISGDDYEQMLLRFGLRAAMGQSLKEMFLGIDHGSIGDPSGTRLTTGGVSFAEWAQTTLKPAFHQTSRASS